MKIKMALVTALGIGCLAAALLWLMDEKVTQERNAALESSLRGSVNALSQALQAEMRGLQRSLPDGTVLSRSRIDWKSFKPFFAVAQARLEGNNFSIQQFAADPAGTGAAWTTDSFGRLLGTVKKNTAPVAGFSLLSLIDENKRRAIAVVERQGDKVWMAVAGPEFLEGLIDQQKGLHKTLAIMNGSGAILAHSTSEYGGTVAPQGSVYAAVLADPSARSFRTYEDGVSEPSIGAFEKVPRTDLSVLAFRSLASVRSDRANVLLFGSLAGLGLMLIAVSAVWMLAGRWENQLTLAAVRRASAAAAVAPAIAAPATGSVAAYASVNTVAAADAVNLQKERKETSLRIASALGHELRAPLASILGYCQMILAGSNEERVTEPAHSILRETRSARDVLDKLLAYAGESNDEKTTTSLGAILARVLKEYEPRIGSKRIGLRKQLRETSEIPLAGDAVEKAIKHVLNNAIEATDRMVKKEIIIELLEEPDELQLSIRDNGEGIEEGDMSRILDPFFTTRSPQQHLGLGLPATLGILKEHGGDLRIESTRGKGTAMTLIFPKPSKTVQLGSEQVVLKTEAKVDIPAQVPVAASEATVVNVPSSPIDIDVDKLFAMDEPTRTQSTSTSTAASMKASFDDEKTVAISLETSTGVNTSVTDVHISKPSFSAPKKTSKLDSVHVDIRRPGTRS